MNVKKITEIVESIKSKEISVTELVQKHITLAKTKGAELNALITITEKEALEKAKELDAQIAKNDSRTLDLALLGIPFTAKDLFVTEGIKTTFGSKLMEDFIPPYTSTVLQKCLDAGAILIGKNNCDPFGFGGSGENSGYGPTKHPLDESRSPGGSSSGSAASLAAGIGFFSLGTDTGGSIRQPAAMTGLFGYKPTYGRNSRYGISSMGSSFDTPGFFTKTVEDLKLIESIIEGKDPLDPTSQHTESKATKEIKTIGVPKEFFSDALNPEIKDAVLKKIEDLKEKGFEIKEVSIPSFEYALAVYYILVPAEISSNRAKFDGVRYGKKVSEDYEQNTIQSRGQFFEDEVKRRIMIGTYVLSVGYSDQFYKKASKVRIKLKREFNDVFKQVDALIGPTTPTTAFKLGEKSENPLEMYLSDIYTVPANIVGIPGISVPIGNDSKNLPIGIQIMSSHFNDYALFDLADEITK